MSIITCNSFTDSSGLELVRHGTPDFPVAAYDECCPVGSHWHDELEAMMIVEGRVIISAGSQRITLCEGEGIFINSGVIHSAEGAGGSFRVHALVFDANIVGDGVSVFRNKYVEPLMRGSEFVRLEECRSLISAWRACEREGFGYEFTVREGLSRLVLEMCRNLPASRKILPSEHRRTERVKIMLTFIRGHFTERIDTADIAGIASISESECLRCFHSVLGTTPMRFLRDYRLKKAERLLASGDMSVSDAAEMCGFWDVSYFTKKFREKNGVTPSEYRANKIPSA